MKTAKELLLNIGAMVVAVLLLVLIGLIQAKDSKAEAHGCRYPKAGQKLVAYGSADGRPVCHYHENLGYGMAPQ